MRRIVFITMAALLAVGSVAAQPMRRGTIGGDRYRGEAEEILDDYSGRVPAELTFGEIEELAGELSIPAQKAVYVAKSTVASLIIPGMGQFMNGDAVAGSLFLAGDLLIAAGTFVGVYYLMPEALRFDQLDYLDTPKSQVKSTWETELGNLTLRDALPIAGVVTGGVILDHLLSRASAKHAGALARERIASGAVEFEPRPEIIIMAGGRFGLGMSMSH
ncbi:MAG: hypothetical protein ACOC2Q_02190 [Spirochaetota bacterium]